MYHELELNKTYLPVLFRLAQADDKNQFDELISKTATTVLDLFSSQKKELFKIRSPKKSLRPADTQALYDEWISDKNPEHEGVWIYYPWSKRILHLLDEDEFIEVRTSRNQHKITASEQAILLGKKIGIVGLSVGNAVALSLATERVCGLIKLADFDILELSNLNRIKTGLHNIGVNKAIITAREIAEIDPFIKIEVYLDGITEENIDGFLSADGNLDLLVEECDELNIKILCRDEAKKRGIPVIMETSDKGMLDVERFDLEPERPIFHGLVGDLDPAKMKNLSNEQKVPLIIRIVDAKNSSLRGRVSLLEVGQSIGTWPQLASAVTLGAGIVTDVTRRILLNHFTDSGRYYVDAEKLVGNKIPEAPYTPENPYAPFSLSDAETLIASLSELTSEFKPALSDIQTIVEAACQAPSTGNDQPWRWVYHEGRLFLFHDLHRAYSFGNFDNIASNLSFGAAFENILLKSNELGLFVKKTLYPAGEDSALVAAITFSSTPDDQTEEVFSPQSVAQIYERNTNRNPSTPDAISAEELDEMKAAVESVPGAELIMIQDPEAMDAIGKIIGGCDRIRLLNAAGHHDFAHREIKWTKEEASLGEGIDVQTLGMSPAQLAALSLIKDTDVAKVLKSINGANALIEVSRSLMKTASGLGIITLPKYTYENFFLGGVSLERVWLKAEMLGYAVYPLISPFYLFPRVLHGNDAGLDKIESDTVLGLREQFLKTVPLKDDLAEVFIFKLGKAEKPLVKSLRLPLSETFFVSDQQAR